MNVITCGTFDSTHAGHFNLLRQIRDLFPTANIFVALNTDEFIFEYKKRKPIFNYKEREKMLEYYAKVLKFRIVKGSGKDSRKIIKKCKADIIVIGNDWLEKDYGKQMGFNAQWLTDNNISLVYLPHTDGISTTLLRERIKNA